MMSRRIGPGPTAGTAVGWIAVVAGIVIAATALSPGWPSARPTEASATGPTSSTAITTTVDQGSSSSTTTTTPPTSASSTTATTGSTSLSTTPDPTGPSHTGPTGSSTTGTTEPPSSSTAIDPVSSTTPITAVTTSTSSPAAAAPGGLSISAPELINLGATPTGAGAFSARLGRVTVTDTRGVVDGTWTVRVSATPFTTGHGSAGERVARASIAYWSGPALAQTGTAVLVPGQPGPSQAVRLTITRTAFSATGVRRINTASWTPTVVIRVPDAAVAGSYRGAIIHSVA